MVKGNWERRIEKADKRKAAKKDAKAAKAKGQLVDPLDILNAVFLKNADAHVWISAPNGAKLCAAHFRQGDCPNRRCKWSHAESLAPWGPAPTDATTEPPVEQVPTVTAVLDGVYNAAEFNDACVLEPLPDGVVARVLDWCSSSKVCAAAAACKALRRAASLSAGVRAQKDACRPRLLAARRRRVLRAARNVRFAGATVEGRRVMAFDAEDADVFRAFARRRREGGAAKPAKRVTKSRPFHALLGKPVPAARVVSCVIGALPDAGITALAACSKRLRALTKVDGDYRARRRRGLEVRTAQKKKKGKRRQVAKLQQLPEAKEAGKKDGFARGKAARAAGGGPCGRC